MNNTEALQALTAETPRYADNTIESNDFGWTFNSKLFETREEAETYAVRFPKGARVRATTLSGSLGTYGQDDYYRFEFFMATADGKLKADGVNGGKNEAGIKRAKMIFKDESVQFIQRFTNGHDFGQFLTALGS